MLNGKTALITGSTSGIGKGIATRLAKEGANVILSGFGDEAEINTLREDIAKTYNVKVGFSSADLTNPDAIESMMAMLRAISAASTFSSIMRAFSMSPQSKISHQKNGISSLA